MSLLSYCVKAILFEYGLGPAARPRQVLSTSFALKFTETKLLHLKAYPLLQVPSEVTSKEDFIRSEMQLLFCLSKKHNSILLVVAGRTQTASFCLKSILNPSLLLFCFYADVWGNATQSVALANKLVLSVSFFVIKFPTQTV